MKRILRSLLAGALVFLPRNAWATDVFGTISSDETWTLAGSPYVVTGEITVNTGATLTVEPGVEVRFNNGLGITVGSAASLGVLIAQGTARQPILFTGTTAVPGHWDGINLAYTNSGSILDHCVIEHAGSAASSYDAAVRIGPTTAPPPTSTSPTVRNCTIRFSATRGIDTLFSAPILENNTITNCGTYGVYIGAWAGTASRPSFQNNTISSVIGSGSYPLHLEITHFPAPFSGNTFENNTNQEIELDGGTIPTDLTLTNAGIPYTVKVADVTVSLGRTLTIQPGVEMRMSANLGFVIGLSTSSTGALVSRGTAGEPIRFVGTSPVPGHWDGINLAHTNASSILEHCVIEHAGSATTSYDAALRIGPTTAPPPTSTSPTVRNCTIRFSATKGIDTLNSAPTLDNNTVTSCGIYGIYLGAWTGATSRPVLQNNTISSIIGSGSYPLHLEITHFPTPFSGNTFANNTNQEIELDGGTIVADLTLPNAGIPYTIKVADITANAGRRLTIQPGVEMRMSANLGLVIGSSASSTGILVAQGTATQPIAFTGTSPLPGHWEGINLAYTNPGSILEHCVIEYGGAGTNNTNVRLASSSPTMRNCTTRYSDGYGILVASPSTATISNNDVAGNGVGGLNATVGVDARLNWWGDASGPSGGGAGTGQSVSANVLFEPWLGGPRNPLFSWTNASVLPDSFSQNGGGTTFHTAWPESATWAITLRDSGQSVVRTFGGSGTTLVQDWNGGGSGGSPLPNGNYSYAVDAVSDLSSATIAPACGRLDLNSALPIARITSPIPDQLVGGTISIVGTAAWPSFASYRVDSGVGFAPTSWTLLANSTSPVTDGLLATWDTVALTAPYYTLRLTVTPTSGLAAVVMVPVRVLALHGIAASPVAISPSGDGIQEATILSVQATHPVSWALDIRDQSSALVGSFTGSGGTISVAWDGRDTEGTVVPLGAVVPDGTYTCRFSATALSDPGVSTASGVLALPVDTVNPTASIETPLENALIVDPAAFSITGTATDSHLLNWSLKRGVGRTPTSFVNVATSTTPVTSGTLYTQNPTAIPDGLYTYRLTVTDTAGNVTTADRHLTIQLMRITAVSRAPEAFQPYGGESTTLQFTLSRPSTTGAVQFYRYPTATLVRTIDLGALPEGQNQVLWNGRDDTVMVLPLDAYYFTISATDSFGSTGTYSNATSPVAGPMPAMSSPSIDGEDFNPYENDLVAIHYTLSRPGLMTLIVRQTNNATIRTVLSSVPRTSGPHIEFWNGRTNGGQMYAGDYEVYFDPPDRLPENAIFLTVPSPLAGAFRAEVWLVRSIDDQVSTIRYALASPAHVTLSVADPAGVVVRTLLAGAPQAAGDHAVEWDARTDTGLVPVAEGCYALNLTAVDSVTGASSTRVGSVLVYR